MERLRSCGTVCYPSSLNKGRRLHHGNVDFIGAAGEPHAGHVLEAVLAEKLGNADLVLRKASLDLEEKDRKYNH